MNSIGRLKDINQYNLWTAVITPLDQNENVDYLDLKKLLKEQEEARNGILILGSTGESLNLSIEDKKEILKFVSTLNLNVPIMVGVGGFNLQQTMNWVDFCETQQVDCYLMVTPLYSKPGVCGQTLWFKTLMDKVNKPCVLYNVPSRTGKSLEFQVVSNLVNHSNFWGIKEASGSVDDFSKYCSLAKNQKVFSGDDILMPEFSKIGASGLISVASNSWPKQTNLYCQKALSNELTKEDIVLWKKACNELFTASNPIPVKCLIHAEGRIKSNKFKLPLVAEDFAEDDLKRLIKLSQEIKNWN